MKCNFCMEPLEAQGQYHPRCMKAVWGVRNFPDWVPLTEEGPQFYHHEHRRGHRATLTPSSARDNMIIELNSHSEAESVHRLLIHQIAFQLKISQAPLAWWEDSEQSYWVQSLSDSIGVERLFKQAPLKAEEYPHLESLYPWLQSQSKALGLDKAQLFDYAVLSYLSGGDLLQDLTGLKLELNFKTQGWDFLDFIVLQGLYDLPPKYLERLLNRIKKQSKKIAHIVEVSPMKSIAKMNFLSNWKDAWEQLQF